MTERISAPVAVVLGGTRPHVALIENLKARGFYTVLVDYYDDPPARAVADRHVRESTLDQDAVLALAREMNARIVISACVDQANVTACYVAEKLGLPAPYSHETALAMSRKSLMKKTMRDHGIPTSPFRVVSQEHELETIDLHYPLVVKPLDSNSSRGVRRADNYRQLVRYYRDARKISRSAGAIVEEFRDGFVVSAYYYVLDGLPKPLVLMRKYFSASTADTVISSHASYVPAQVSVKTKIIIEQVANLVARAFGLSQTPLMIELLVNGDEVNVIEATPRIGGGLSYRVIELSMGVDLISATIDAYFRAPADLSENTHHDVFLIQNIYAAPGTLAGIIGDDDLLGNKVIDEIYRYKTPGMKIGLTLSSGDRVGSIIVRAKTLGEALEKNERAMSQLAVLDDSGQDIMRHDIYLRRENV